MQTSSVLREMQRSHEHLFFVLQFHRFVVSHNSVEQTRDKKRSRAKTQHQAKCRSVQMDKAAKPSMLSKHYTSHQPRSPSHPISSPRITRIGRIRRYRSAIIHELRDAHEIRYRTYRARRAGSSCPSAGEALRYWAISRGEAALWREGVLDRELRSESWLPSSCCTGAKRSVGGLFDADELEEFDVLSSDASDSVR
jgi:hypothetical protein